MDLTGYISSFNPDKIINDAEKKIYTTAYNGAQDAIKPWIILCLILSTGAIVIALAKGK